MCGAGKLYSEPRNQFPGTWNRGWTPETYQELGCAAWRILDKYAQLPMRLHSSARGGTPVA